ncbi:hypothetical protein [Streptomyces cinereoruber]|uniref:hypothetical protein n=1 Tax=Streptomyces cinereoruber TaxID=67260 RepID=UPI003638F377
MDYQGWAGGGAELTSPSRRLPGPVAGTDTDPRFERSVMVAWLLAHDKIGVPSAALTLWSDEEGERHFWFDVPVLKLADADADDRLSGWTTDNDADVLAVLAADDTGVSVRRLTTSARGAGPDVGARPVPVRLRRPTGHPRVAHRPARYRRSRLTRHLLRRAGEHRGGRRYLPPAHGR